MTLVMTACLCVADPTKRRPAFRACLTGNARLEREEKLSSERERARAGNN